MLHFPSPEQAAGVIMENYVVVEVGAMVEASRIGEGTIIEVNAKVGRGAVLGKVSHCVNPNAMCSRVN
jgi:dynactin-6